MHNFSFYAPTQVVFGRGAAEQLGPLVKARDCQKVLLHYGGGSAQRSGLLDRVRAALEAEGVAFIELGGVAPTPG